MLSRGDEGLGQTIGVTERGGKIRKKEQFKKCKCRETPHAMFSRPPLPCVEHEFSGVARSIKNITLE